MNQSINTQKSTIPNTRLQQSNELFISREHYHHYPKMIASDLRPHYTYSTEFENSKFLFNAKQFACFTFCAKPFYIYTASLFISSKSELDVAAASGSIPLLTHFDDHTYFPNLRARKNIELFQPIHHSSREFSSKSL